MQKKTLVYEPELYLKSLVQFYDKKVHLYMPVKTQFYTIHSRGLLPRLSISSPGIEKLRCSIHPASTGAKAGILITNTHLYIQYSQKYKFSLV